MQHYYYPNFQFDASHPSEWDESSFAAKPKHGRGPRREPVWVLGGVQRGTNVVILKVVDNREDPTLVPIIFSNVIRGATIITDAFAAYNSLGSLGFNHWSVNHPVSDTLTVNWHSLKCH